LVSSSFADHNDVVPEEKSSRTDQQRVATSARLLREAGGIQSLRIHAKALAKLHDPKDLSALRALGGVRGLLLGLKTNAKEGLSSEELFWEGR
jgi:hypothetical protein